MALRVLCFNVLGAPLFMLKYRFFDSGLETRKAGAQTGVEIFQKSQFETPFCFALKLLFRHIPPPYFMIPSILMIKAPIDIHLERKITHIAGAVGMVVVHHFCPEWLSWAILFTLGLPLIIFDFLRLRNDYLHQLTPKIFGRIMRRRELNGITGTTYMLLGTGLIFALFPHDIVALSLLFLAFADPIASFVGLKFGTHKILGKKTFEGSLAAFVICVIVAALFFNFKNIMTAHFLVASLMAGVIGCMSELIPIAKLDDNFTQPVANAIFLYGLFYLFGGFA